MAIRLVLADEHPIVLDGLGSLFHPESDFQVLARCVNGDQTVAAVRRHRPDVLILDTRLPGKSGLDVLRELHKDGLPTRVVLFVAALDEDEVLDALRLGVRGMVLKELASQLLMQCVRKVHAGEQWLEKQLSSRALDTLLRRETVARGDKRGLTLRELEIVRMAAGGLSTRGIAKQLAVSEGTVKIHLHNVYKKLNVQNRVELVLYAQSKRLV